MANKEKRVTVRLSDDMLDLINRQEGETFTQRFEALVTRCTWELPNKQRELALMDQKIDRERRVLSKLSSQVFEYQRLVDRLGDQLGGIGKLLDDESKSRSA